MWKLSQQVEDGTDQVWMEGLKTQRGSIWATKLRPPETAGTGLASEAGRMEHLCRHSGDARQSVARLNGGSAAKGSLLLG